MKQAIPAEEVQCVKCGAKADQLCFGGVGDWRNKVMCEACFHFWIASPRLISEWAAAQLGVDPERLRAADEASQKEFEQVTLGGPNFPDLPEALPVARWLARRLALRP